MKVYGLNHHRLKVRANAPERAMAEAWAKQLAASPGHLKHLLDDGADRRPAEITERDDQIAATVIQWLGSPVGQHWLANALGDAGLKALGKLVDRRGGR